MHFVSKSVLGPEPMLTRLYPFNGIQKTLSPVLDHIPFLQQGGGNDFRIETIHEVIGGESRYTVNRPVIFRYTFVRDSGPGSVGRIVDFTPDTVKGAFTLVVSTGVQLARKVLERPARKKPSAEARSHVYQVAAPLKTRRGRQVNEQTMERRERRAALSGQRAVTAGEFKPGTE